MITSWGCIGGEMLLPALCPSQRRSYNIPGRRSASGRAYKMICPIRKLVVLAAVLITLANGASAQTDSLQDFNSWPLDLDLVWKTNTVDGWTLHDGIVHIVLAGFGNPISGAAAWLPDDDISTNSWIQSPYLPYGAGEVSFYARRSANTSNEHFFALQHSANGTNWVTAQNYDRMQDGWNEFSTTLDILTPLYVRILKFGDGGQDQVLGLEDFFIELPAGIKLSNLSLAPAAPTITDSVHVQIDLEAGPNGSNAVLTLYYRNAESGAFAAIAMSDIGGNVFKTVSPIPAGLPDIVQYYIEANYEGIGPKPVFVPESGSNNPAFYNTSSPFLSKESRQLNQSSHRTPLIISEIMYNPKGDDDTNSLEYVEIFNTQPVEVRLGGYRLSGDIDYTFPAGFVLPERGFIVVARDPVALQAEYAVGNTVGPFTGVLPNDNGTVRLRNRTDALLLEVDYDDECPWPIAADGAGHSLTLTKPDYGEGTHDAWGISRSIGGTPALDDPPTNTPLDDVVINEFLAHTDLPQTDFIELYNRGDQAVDISGCFLSETTATNKFQIPTNTILAAGTHIAFAQATLGFSLSSHGDEIYFVNADETRVIDAIRFPAQRNGVTTGRLPDGAPDFYVLASPTTNAPNTQAGERYEDIVINEIMYHPISGDNDDEYVELYNRSSNAVDVGYWRFIDGIDFTIPSGTIIPAGGYLVVGRDIANLFTKYPHLNAGNTVGNFSGRLSNQGEKIILAKPDDLALPFEDFVVIDEVHYGDGDDWGDWTDGGGSSLELIDPRADNRRGMNWEGSDETGKATWTEVDHLGTIANGGETPDQIRFMHLGGGECLIDDLVVEQNGGATTYVADDFNLGLGSWTIYGNHSRSELGLGTGVGGSHCLHFRASDSGNHGTWAGWGDAFFNHARRPVALIPPPGTEVRIKAKVKWQKGWPHMTIPFKGFWMEAPVKMDLPPDLGSPAQQNSIYAANTGPAIDRVQHQPVLPAASEPVVVSTRVHDPDGVLIVTLNYRLDPSPTFTSISMLDNGTLGDRVAGDGIYSATVPGQSASAVVAFTIEAMDAAGVPKSSDFPGDAQPNAPALECLVGFGQSLKSGILANYVMWMTQSNIDLWNLIPGGKYSNEPQHLTFAYGPYRAIYNAGARWRGLWRGYSTPVSSGAYSVEVPKQDRFMGQNEFKIDQPGQNGSDTTRMNELVTFWVAREIDIPSPQIRFAHIYVNNNFRGTFHDLQVPSTDFNKSWFNDDDPRVFKDVGWQPPDPYQVYKDGFGNYSSARYRWYWRRKKGATPNDDFTTVYNLSEAAHNFPHTTTGRKRVEALVDIRGWAGFFGVCGAVGGWDHYGFAHAHNMFSYVPYHKPGWLFVYDMDHVFSGGSTVFPGASWAIPNRMYNQYDPFRRVSYAIAKELLEGPFDTANHDAFIDSWYDALLANNGSQSSGGPVSDPGTKKAWLNAASTALQAIVSPLSDTFAITENDFSSANHIVTLSGATPAEVSRIGVNGILNDVEFTGIDSWTLDLGLPEGTNALTVTGYDWRGSSITSDTITVTITAPPPSPVDKLIITEIMYHPTKQASEYVELYNNSSNTFDMRGWRLNGTDIMFEGGSIIGPEEYKVVAENRTAYQHSYGNVELAVGDYDGNLDNGGETISLQMPMGSNAWITVDTVTYDDEAPWPTLPDGLGQSLQLIDINQDNNRAGNWGPRIVAASNEWKFTTITGIVSNNVFQLLDAKLHAYTRSAGQAYIDKIMLVTGAVAEVGENLLDNGDFETDFTATWQANGNHSLSTNVTTPVFEGSNALELTGAGAGLEDTDAVVQPKSLFERDGDTLTLSYYYYVTQSGPDLTVYMEETGAGMTHSTGFPPPPTNILITPGEPNSISATLFEFPLLWINEVMPSNASVVTDNMGEFEPWIELYNADADPVSLDDYLLSDSYSQLNKWAFPTGITMAAGERLVVWADGEGDETAPGHPHTSFALDADAGAVVLSRIHTGVFVVVDYLNYSNVGENASFGAFPEGQFQDRHIFPTPTPGAANSPSSPVVPVVINEWMSDNDTTIQDPTDGNYEDWFELFNTSGDAVSLGGYYLTDDLDVTNQFTIPGGTMIPADGHMLIWADNDAENNSPGTDLHVNFRLSSSGEDIALYAPDGTLIDSVSYAPQGSDVTHGLWPDGTPSIYQLTTPTPGSTNSLFAVIDIESLGPGGFGFNTAGESGSVYCVEVSENLMNTNWLLIDIITADTAVLTFIDTNAPSMPLRFYRVIEKP